MLKALMMELFVTAPFQLAASRINGNVFVAVYIIFPPCDIATSVMRLVSLMFLLKPPYFIVIDIVIDQKRLVRP